MSLLTSLQDFIHRLDTEAAADLGALQAEFTGKLAQVLPVLVTLENDVKTAVSEVAEQAAPGITAALQAAVAKAENDLRRILGL